MKIDANKKFITTNYDISHPEIVDAVGHLESFKTKKLIIVGMGGASSCSKTLEFFDKHKQLVFFDTTDFDYIKTLDISNSTALVISKSGNTAETIELTKYLIDVGHKNFHFILKNTNSELMQICSSLKASWSKYQHSSGRFAIFSDIVYVVMKFLNLNIENFILGAKNIDVELVKLGTNFMQSNISLPINVNISFSRSLDNLLSWNNQIISESLNKNNFGFMPILSKFPEEQHSSLQAFLDGPKNKFFNIFRILNSNQNDLSHLQSEMLYKSFVDQSIPTRLITVPNLDEYHLGQLALLLILESINLGIINSIDAYSQHHVDSFKCKLFKLQRKQNDVPA